MNQMYPIRNANLSDLKQILAIIEDARNLSRSLNSKQWLASDGYPNSKTFETDINNQELFVALSHNRVVGVIAISSRVEPTYNKIHEGNWLIANPRYGVIHRLAVKKEFYGKGVSISLMNHAESIFKSLNVLTIRIDTAKENQPMQRLINKLNYKYCGIIKLGKYAGEDDLRLAFEKII